MRSGLIAVGMSCLCLVLGCGSDDKSPSGAAGAAAGATAGSSGAASQAGSSSGGTSGGGTSGGGTSEQPQSEACKTYCTCHETNCAAYAIPDGKSCAAFCAGMTADQLACRQVMCKLVPDQPNNDHCTHSLGINQCQ